ncbi:PQQ-dependent sugar dehydrogenase [Membranihabitans maritimus]|uniref:PQQ-dependent sugar dehydrogenase n=1 Tax=Membranihabitans maritimus TaxID=2904244 RepID=UPI001F3FC3BA|nr:PQQ-dependent sugar dehydrogenase [Membranihabitans maritimus]
MSSLKFLYFLLLGLFISSCTQQSPDAQQIKFQFAVNNGGITLPDSFQAVVVADSVGAARHIAVNDNGDIYVALRSAQDGNGLVALRDTNGDGKADSTAYFGEYTGTGVRIHDNHLYFSSTTAVYRYPLKDEQLVPEGEPETIISGFPDQNTHAAKSFTFDNEGNIYVNVGAPSNSCQEEARTPGSLGIEPCPQLERQAGVWQFNATKTGQTQVDDGHRYATGIRNSVALRWSSTANALYSVQHGRDQLSTLWPDYFDNKQSALLPSEDFLLIKDGSNFGWPYTYYDWQKDQRILAPEYGGDGEKTPEAGKYQDPIMTFPGHWAPNDVLFYSGEQFPESYGSGAFIAFHGSWNRAPEPQAGYKVVFVPFSGELPSGDYKVFADNFAGKESFTSPSDAKHRPMGLAVGPDGSLYITDSAKGKIWRILYTGGEEMM